MKRALSSTLQKLKQAEEELKGPKPEALYDRLERERPQLEAAMRWFLEHGHPQRAMELASLVWRFWVNRGHLEEGRSLMKAALQASSSDEQTPLRADALHGAGTLAFQQGDNESAHAHFEQSLSIGRRLAKTDAIVRALHGLGRVALRKGDYAEVRKLSNEAMTLARTSGDRELLTSPLHMLAAVSRMEGDYQGAAAFYRESIEVNQSLGNVRRVTMELINLGSVEFLSGNLDKAAEFYTEGLSKAYDLGDRYLLPVPFIGLGGVAAARGDGVRAARLLAIGEGLEEAAGSVLDPDDRPIFDRSVEAARTATDPKTFTTAWAEGRAMPVERAFEYALFGKGI